MSHTPILAISTAAGDWIPQSGAMRLIDRVVFSDETTAAAEVDVPPDGLFTRDGVVPSWIGIEYMAQTIAAWATARARRAGREGARVGLLLGSRRYEAFCDGFAAGTTLRVEVQNEWDSSNGMGLFDCRILQAGRLMAKARVTVFEPAEGARFFSTGNTE